LIQVYIISLDNQYYNNFYLLIVLKIYINEYTSDFINNIFKILVAVYTISDNNYIISCKQTE